MELGFLADNLYLFKDEFLPRVASSNKDNDCASEDMTSQPATIERPAADLFLRASLILRFMECLQFVLHAEAGLPDVDTVL